MEITKCMIEKGSIFYCDSKEKAYELLKKCHELGYKWDNGQSFLEEDFWDSYHMNTCYNIYEGAYAPLSYYCEQKWGKIIEYILDKDCGDFFINCPLEYRRDEYECVKTMEKIFGVEKVKSFCELSSFKYLWHSHKKNKDFKKAIWYLNYKEQLKEKVGKIKC